MVYKIFQLLLLLNFIHDAIFQGAPRIVATPRGIIQGYHYFISNDTTQLWHGEADVFTGIPFALPPIENLRYKYPRPIVQIPGPSPYNATYYRSECVQRPEGAMSEDCLYFNIYAPNVSSTTKYPVMVSIHGGALINGNSQMGLYGIIRNFILKGIIIAAMEYRLSWLGYFTTFTEDFPPNIGQLDQLLAMRMIKEIIPYFGGDPNRITLQGESAGAFAASFQLFSPLSRGLFQQAIIESGDTSICYEGYVGATYRNMYIAQKACNIQTSDWEAKNFTALKSCMMEISIEDGLNAFDGSWTANDICANAVQDNFFFPGTPQQLYKSRPNIPVITGLCKDEYVNWEMYRVNGDKNLSEYTRQQVEQRLLNQYVTWLGNGTKAQQVLQFWENTYLPANATDDDHLTWLQFAVDVGTAAFFAIGHIRNVEYYIINKNPDIYAYEWTRSSKIDFGGLSTYPEWHPVPHGCEVAYVLGYGEGGDWTPEEQALANLAQGYWQSFILTGKPSTDGSWKPATSTNFTTIEYMDFNLNSSSKVGFRQKDVLAFDQFIENLIGDFPPNIPDTYPVCPRGKTSSVRNTTCYETFPTSLYWNDAQHYCAQNSYGALTTIGSGFENNDALTYAKHVGSNCSSFHIGLFRSQFVNGSQNWFWVNYDTNTYRNWASGYPIQDPNANCVVLTSDGTWKNQDCYTLACYICSYL